MNVKPNNNDRTWPIPPRRWTMRMNWHDLLFMHWKVDAQVLRSLIPEPLEIDLFEGDAWIGVVPFRMTGVAPRFIPHVPFMSRFPELNVRTYVTVDGKPGVWFFCLEATNPVAVRVARSLFHLPYMDAKIDFNVVTSGDGAQQTETDSWIHYRSQRTHRNELPASIDVEYRPTGSPFNAAKNSIEEFLTSRYCLYAANSSNEIFRGEIDHEPWELRRAEAKVRENRMTQWLGIELPNEPPLLHFAAETRVVAWSLERVVG